MMEPFGNLAAILNHNACGASRDETCITQEFYIQDSVAKKKRKKEMYTGFFDFFDGISRQKMRRFFVE